MLAPSQDATGDQWDVRAVTSSRLASANAAITAKVALAVAVPAFALRTTVPSPINHPPGAISPAGSAMTSVTRECGTRASSARMLAPDSLMFSVSPVCHRLSPARRYRTGSWSGYRWAR